MATPIYAATSSINTLPKSSSSILPPISTPADITLNGISNVTVQTGGNPFLLMSGYYSAGEQNLIGAAGGRSSTDGGLVETMSSNTVPCNGICKYSYDLLGPRSGSVSFNIPTSRQMCDDYVANLSVGSNKKVVSYTESTCEIATTLDAGKHCQQQTDANPAYCDVQIKSGLNKQCPLGFAPFIHISINNARDIGNTQAFACITDPYNPTDGPKLSGPFSKTTFPYRKGVYPVNGEYTFTVRMSGTPTATQILPGVSFNWLLYCYPHQSAPPLPPPCGKSRIADAPPNILIWDTGTLDHVETTYPAATQTINTHRRCPLGYTPYATITAGTATAYSSDGDLQLPSQKGICVSNVTTNDANHTISFNAVASKINMEYSSEELIVYGYAPRNYLTPVQWTLYCLPFGLPAPDYFSGKCSPTYKAYKPASDGTSIDNVFK